MEILFNDENEITLEIKRHFSKLGYKCVNSYSDLTSPDYTLFINYISISDNKYRFYDILPQNIICITPKEECALLDAISPFTPSSISNGSHSSNTKTIRIFASVNDIPIKVIYTPLNIISDKFDNVISYLTGKIIHNEHISLLKSLINIIDIEIIFKVIEQGIIHDNFADTYLQGSTISLSEIITYLINEYNPKYSELYDISLDDNKNIFYSIDTIAQGVIEHEENI